MIRAALLPEGAVHLAADEVVLWRGRPGATALARRLFHVRPVALYLAGLAAVNAALAVADASASALAACGWIVLAGIAVEAFLHLAAFCLSRTTLYVVTDRRVILHIGVALPIALTLPLRKIASADLRLYPDGSGDIPLTLDGGKLAYLLVWPHARPWRFAAPQPMLRAVPDARDAAAVLAGALSAVSPAGQGRVVRHAPEAPRALPAGAMLADV